VSTTPLHSFFSLRCVCSLPFGDLDQKRPQIIAVIQLREFAKFCAPAKARESALHNIFFVADSRIPSLRFEFISREPKEFGAVPIPNFLHGDTISLRFEPVDPLGHRIVRHHF
jgi:hypothetical protein